MRSVADGFIGVIARQQYRVELWRTSAPKAAHTNEDWVYLTKLHNGGLIENRSIGLPLSDLSELVEMLKDVNKIDRR